MSFIVSIFLPQTINSPGGGPTNRATRGGPTLNPAGEVTAQQTTPRRQPRPDPDPLSQGSPYHLQVPALRVRRFERRGRYDPSASDGIPHAVFCEAGELCLIWLDFNCNYLIVWGRSTA